MDVAVDREIDRAQTNRLTAGPSISADDGGSREPAALVEHGYSGPRRCSDALSLEYQNAEYDEDQRQQPSNAERFLQEHEPNKQDNAHLGCCDYW